MFQFSTTNVINSLNYLDGKDLLCAIGANGVINLKGKDLSQSDNKNLIGSANQLIVKGIGQFNKDNITAIYKAAAKDPQLEKVEYTLNISDAKKGDVYRLNIYVGLSQGSADSAFANDLSFKGKPFSIEFVWKDGGASATVTALVETINKYELLVYGDKILNVEDGGNGKLIISATNEYQRFKNISIEKFVKNVDDYSYGGNYEEVVSFDTIKGVNNANFTAGSEGVGTYAYLLHNIRIPTDARTRAFAPNSDEAPVIGAKYDQYTIHYCVNRGVLGMNAVGDTVKSVTNHVFFVKSDLSAEFEKYLKALIGDTPFIEQTIGAKTKDTKTPNPGTLKDDIAKLSSTVATKQDKLSAGNGIDLTDNKVSVKVASGGGLTADANGLKVNG